MTGVPDSPLIVGFRFVLASKEFASVLRSLEIPGVTYEKATIWDARRRREINTHFRLRIDERFEYDEVRDLELEGLHMLVMGEEALFVSPSLMRALQRQKLNFLRFSEGLSEFASSERAVPERRA